MCAKGSGHVGGEILLRLNILSANTNMLLSILLGERQHHRTLIWVCGCHEASQQFLPSTKLDSLVA